MSQPKNKIFIIKKLRPSAQIPKRQTPQATGYDLHVSTHSNTSYFLPPNSVNAISTGIAIEIPPSYTAEIRGRSGLAIAGIWCHNGTIDSDYRGEIKVILANLNNEPFLLDDGDRVAQLVFSQVVEVDFTIGDLENSERGEGGFGSTGQ